MAATAIDVTLRMRDQATKPVTAALRRMTDAGRANARSFEALRTVLRGVGFYAAVRGIQSIITASEEGRRKLDALTESWRGFMAAVSREVVGNDVVSTTLGFWTETFERLSSAMSRASQEGRSMGSAIGGVLTDLANKGWVPGMGLTPEQRFERGPFSSATTSSSAGFAALQHARNQREGREKFPSARPSQWGSAGLTPESVALQELEVLTRLAGTEEALLRERFAAWEAVQQMRADRLEADRAAQLAGVTENNAKVTELERAQFEAWEAAQMQKADREEALRQANLDGVAENNAAVAEANRAAAEEVAAAWQATGQQIAGYFSSALNSMLFYGDSFRQAVANLFRSLGAAVVQTIVSWVATYIVQSLLSMVQAGQEMAAKVAANSAITYSAAFASSVGFLGPGAAGYAGGLTSAMQAGAAASYAEALGIFSALGAPKAHGGWTSVGDEVPAVLQRGERVLSRGQNDDLTSFLDARDGGQATVVLQLNDRELGRALVDLTRAGRYPVTLGRV